MLAAKWYKHNLIIGLETPNRYCIGMHNKAKFSRRTKMKKYERNSKREYELKGVFDSRRDAVARRDEFKSHGRFVKLIKDGNKYGVYVAG